MTAIVRFNPFGTLAVREPFDLLDEFEDLVGGLWNSWEPVVWGTNFSPSLDVYEDKDELVVKAELPGVEKDALDIAIEGEMLHIKAEKKAEKQEEDKSRKYYASERTYGEYHRSIPLPYPIETGKASATFKDGVLEIRLPKAEEAKPKQVQIKAQ